MTLSLPDEERPTNKGSIDVTRDGAVANNIVVESPILDDWSPVFSLFNLDAAEFDVVDDTVRMSTWQQSRRTESGDRDTVQLYSYSAKFRRKAIRQGIDALVKAAKGTRSRKPPVSAANGTSAFVVALGDLQLGKADGDGVKGTVERFYAKTADAVARYERIANGAPVYLLHLGDCIEGFMSQGGANGWRTTLTTTEQVDLYQTLVLDQVKAFSAVAPSLTLAGIPGNHDEAHRPIHTYGDSWAIQALKSVKMALDLAGNYEHVTIHIPARDELTLTLDVAGTRVGLAHGHQFRGGWQKWWSGNSHGRQPIGEADILFAGHFHHLQVIRESRTYVQVPALESESTWWRHETGGVSEPGIVTMLVGGGGWRSLEVL